MDYDSAISLAGTAGAQVSRETLVAKHGTVLAEGVIAQVETAIKYAGYVERQRAAVERAAGEAAVAIPADFDYSALGALSIEARQVLARRRPETLADAARLPGITPVAIAALRVHLKKSRRGPRVADAA